MNQLNNCELSSPGSIHFRIQIDAGVTLLPTLNSRVSGVSTGGRVSEADRVSAGLAHLFEAHLQVLIS
jgi:L-lysine 2,3-aminomutase